MTFNATFSSDCASDADFRSGFLTLLGRPNAGKSTLLNALLGKKLAITSSTAQTTRHRFRGILTTDDYQLVIVDTPGVHKPHDMLGEELNTTALRALQGIDIIAFLLDAHEPLGKGDLWILGELKKLPKVPKILVISKCDLADQDQIDLQIQKAQSFIDWDSIVALSSVTSFNLDLFLKEVVSYLPHGPHWFPADMQTDQPLEVLIAEFVREKILLNTSAEVPHSIGVVVDDLTHDKKKTLYKIYATIYVERDSQKGILIGKAGSRIKQIGTEARKDLEVLLGEKVFLNINVKVKKNWRRDLDQIRRFGYGEGI